MLAFNIFSIAFNAFVLGLCIGLGFFWLAGFSFAGTTIAFYATYRTIKGL